MMIHDCPQCHLSIDTIIRWQNDHTVYHQSLSVPKSDRWIVFKFFILANDLEKSILPCPPNVRFLPIPTLANRAYANDPGAHNLAF